MSGSWDPIGYLRDKYGETRPVEDWPDEAFEEILEDDPLAIGVPAIAVRVGTWPREKRAIYHARNAIAGILFNVLAQDCANLCGDSERDRHWIAGRIAKKLTRVCDHEFAEIAMETTDDGVAFGEADGRLPWEWCIRCGILRLGRDLYRPGPHQSKAITSNVPQGPRVPSEG